MRLMVCFNKMTMMIILFVITEDEDFCGFSFNMELYQMVTWMFGWKIREVEDVEK